MSTLERGTGLVLVHVESYMFCVNGGIVSVRWAPPFGTLLMRPRPSRVIYSRKLHCCFVGQGLESAIGSESYVMSFVAEKVRGWSEERELSRFVESQPRAVYYVLTHGLSSCWLFVSQDRSL